MKKVLHIVALLIAIPAIALIKEQQEARKELVRKEFQQLSGLINSALQTILPPAGRVMKKFDPAAVDFTRWDAAVATVKKYVREHEAKQLMLESNDVFRTIKRYNTYLKSLYAKGRVLGAGAPLYTRMDTELAKLSELLDKKEQYAERQQYPEAVRAAVRLVQLLVRALQTANAQIMAYYDAIGVDQTLAAMKPLAKSEKQQSRPLLSTDSQKRYEQLSTQIQEPSLSVFDVVRFDKVFMDVYQFADEYGKDANTDQAQELRSVLTTLRAKGVSLSQAERAQLELDIRGAWLRARQRKNKIDQKWFGSRAKAQAYELYALLWNKVLEGFTKQQPAGKA